MMAPGTVKVRDNHRIDLQKLYEYFSIVSMKGCFPKPWTSLQTTTISQFSDGQSNPTYLIRDTSSGLAFVLRKKPPGKILPSAHAVEREYLIMSALSKASFPVPEMYHLCEDASIIGTPFYVMGYVQGRIFSDPLLKNASVS